jgi:hypothetical protein
MKKNEINLTPEQRKKLDSFSRAGTHSVHLVRRARVILLLDTSENRKATTFMEITKRLEISMQTINNVKRDFFDAENIDDFLQRKKRATPPVAPKITGDVQAKIIALACSGVPEGYARWSLQLLADKTVELGFVDSISDMSIHRLLKKRNLSLT